MRFSQLWSFSGRTDRKSYALIGVIAFAIKSNIDRMVATYGFRHGWGLLNYWFPFPSKARPTGLHGNELSLGLTLLAISAPFIYLGICQTVRRLRDCAWPIWLSVFFFVPFVNLLFFLILCLQPSRVTLESPREDVARADKLRLNWSDGTKWTAALVSIMSTTVFGVALSALATKYPADYGWGLFVGMPFCLGLFSVLVYSYGAPRSFGQCISVAVFPVVLIGGALLLLAFEGILCLVMAAPIGLGLAALGGVVGYAVQEGRWRMRGRPAVLGVVLLIAPMWMQLDPWLQGEPPVRVVRSSIEISAPPEIVWQKVIAFSEIPAEREFIFHTGIAYPLRATIAGNGPGAIRRCEFSTGAFVEPIQVWEQPKLLQFSVTENPAPLEELTPYHHIEPPHLKGYFVSKKGQFELTRLEGNRTRLTGTTWYTDNVWPGAYWQVWSDYIIHHIHLRVLRHIQAEAEDRYLAARAD
jgi:uncharacterized membrane protein YhaH (DUF805 family)